MAGDFYYTYLHSGIWNRKIKQIPPITRHPAFLGMLVNSANNHPHQVKSVQFSKILSPFFGNMVNIKSFCEKICKLHTNWGKNMHFPHFFHPLSIIFFPPACYLAIFLVKQKNIHPCIDLNQSVYTFLKDTLIFP